MPPIEPSPKTKPAKTTSASADGGQGGGLGEGPRNRQKQPKMIWPNAGAKRRANAAAKPESLRPTPEGPGVANAAAKKTANSSDNSLVNSGAPQAAMPAAPVETRPAQASPTIKAQAAPPQSVPPRPAPNPGPGNQGQGKPAGNHPQGPQNQGPGGPKLPTAKPAQTQHPDIPPVVGPAKLKRRHNFALLSFFLTVLLPSLAAIAYLYTVAVDQYASTVGFSVRNEETSAASSILGGLSSITGGSTSQDSDTLYEFIQSQQMVERIETRLNLREMFSKPKDDVVFAFPTDGSLEKLVDYWQRVISIAYDGGTGLILIESSAFSPQDAQAVTTAIYEESNLMIHELSAKAREDATRYAREDLTNAEDRLKAARAAINEYRSRTQIVDPTASVQSQMGILNQLQSQTAEALIQLDMLRATTRADDPRINEADLKIAVIEKRIAEERQKFGLGGQGIGNDDFATVVAEFERLSVDRDFAERSYLAALTALDAAKAEAQRQSRYLAVFISPTLAETAEYPRRALLSALAFMFLSLGWSIIALIYYSVRDRR